MTLLPGVLYRSAGDPGVVVDRQPRDVDLGPGSDEVAGRPHGEAQPVPQQSDPLQP